MKLEIEVNVADNVADKVQLEEYLRKIVALFSDGRIPAGKAARELGLSRIQFIEFFEPARPAPRYLFRRRLEL